MLTLVDLGASLPEKAPGTRWLDEDNFVSTPLAEFLSELLDAWAQYYTWVSTTFAFDDCSDAAECELFEAVTELEHYTLDLSLAIVDEEFLVEMEVAPERLRAFHEETRSKVADRIHEVCVTRVKYGLPITKDYYQLLRLAPIELAEQTWFPFHESEKINDYLPYGEQLILRHLEYQAISLNQIHSKLDKLLSVE